MRKKQTLINKYLLMLLTIMLIMSGCASDSSETDNEKTDNSNDEPTYGGKASFGYIADISSWDPIKGTTGLDHALLFPIYDTLIDFTEDLEPIPGLAKEWEFVDDETMVLELEENVTFHDDTPFNAEAVKFNIERGNSDESQYSDLESIDSVEVLDEFKVQFNLSNPDSSLELALSDRGGMMISPSAVKDLGEDFVQSPIGTGPFEMVSHTPNGEIVYEKNEDYWIEGFPYLDEMNMKIMTDENTRINALESGEIDYAHFITAGNIESFENNPSFVVEDEIGISARVVFINTDQPPYDDKAFRQAFLHGIDRELMSEAINYGYGGPAYQVFPEGYWPADDKAIIEHDPEKSKQLLKDAELEGVSAELLVYGLPYDEKIGESIKDQLNDVGINIELNTMEQTSANASFFNEHNHGAVTSAWTGRPDPQVSIAGMFGNDAFYNTGEHSTDELQALIDEAAEEYDQDKRAELYAEINEIAVKEEAIVIPIIFEPQVAAMNLDLQGFKQNLQAKPKFSETWLSE